MPAWPASLPCPAPSSWSAEPTPRTVAFQTDSGIPRHHQVNDEAWWILTFEVRLPTPAARAALEAFAASLSTAVDEGFTFKRPDTGATVTCRFTEDGWPKYAGLGRMQRASVTLIAEPD